jgi:anaerobic ribonucleoside-triphosphate reductase activating protein
MKYSDIQILLQEVPGEISICFTITGCQIHCEGCHSSHLWNSSNGHTLSNETYDAILNKYKDYASCVLFMGGEWHNQELIEKLKYAKKLGYETCLYSGEKVLEEEILNELTWVKTGPWIKEFGGLDSQTTNQIFKEVKTNTTLNHLFQRN